MLSTRCTASFPVLDAVLCAALLSLIRDSGGSSCKKLKYFQTFSLPQIWYNNSIAHREGFRHGFYHPSGAFTGAERRRGRIYFRSAAGAAAGGSAALSCTRRRRRLPRRGYALEAASRRGYRLLGGDPFCTEAVGPYPAPVQLYDTLESTNRTAKLLALEGAVHGTLVLAGGQTAGRGRLGRSFTSPAGKGVYCSVVLRPPLPAANAQTAPSARQWQCAGRCRCCVGWNLPSSG